jgi:hypothetical protein
VWLVGATLTPAASAQPGSSDLAGSRGVQQIIVVFKTHFDIGYTDLARNIVERYRTTMIDQVLDVVDHRPNSIQGGRSRLAVEASLGQIRQRVGAARSVTARSSTARSKASRSTTSHIRSHT